MLDDILARVTLEVAGDQIVSLHFFVCLPVVRRFLHIRFNGYEVFYNLQV